MKAGTAATVMTKGTERAMNATDTETVAAAAEDMEKATNAMVMTKGTERATNATDTETAAAAKTRNS